MGSRNGRFLAYNADLHVLPSVNLELKKTCFASCTLVH